MPRQTGKIKPNKTFLLVVEGETEKSYFSDIKSYDHIPGITIISKIAKYSSLNTILKTAIDDKKKGVYDSVWCVFDRDVLTTNEVSKGVDNLLKKCQKARIQFADSLPAFEVWFLLHYVMPSNYYQNQEAVINELKHYIKDYSKNQNWQISNLHSQLRFCRQTAIENAKKLEKRNNTSDDNTTTMCNVHKLLEELGIKE